MNTDFIHIFGIRFLDGGYGEAQSLLRNGKMMVVPAAPALANIEKDPDYWKALKESDFAIFDSGFLVLLTRLFWRVRVEKLSGLRFLLQFLKDEEVKQASIFLVDPTEEDRQANHKYLRSIGFQLELSDHYVAPMYDGQVKDSSLLKLLREKKPMYVIINLAGGVQEKLGLFIKNHMDTPPGIICTGAALAFITGRQASIPAVVDRLYMGWLARCINSPTRYIPRYLSGFYLIRIFLKLGGKRK